MNTYAIVKKSGRELFIVRSIVSVDKTVNNPHYIDITSANPQPQVGWYYTKDDGFSERAAAGSERVLDAFTFYYGRLTGDELGDITALAINNGNGLTLDHTSRGKLAAFLELTRISVQLDHRATVDIFNMLETEGAIQAGRAAEILG